MTGFALYNQMYSCGDGLCLLLGEREKCIYYTYHKVNSNKSLNQGKS
jgi:hypothetical protein